MGEYQRSVVSALLVLDDIHECMFGQKLFSGFGLKPAWEGGGREYLDLTPAPAVVGAGECKW